MDFDRNLISRVTKMDATLHANDSKLTLDYFSIKIKEYVKEATRKVYCVMWENCKHRRANMVQHYSSFASFFLHFAKIGNLRQKIERRQQKLPTGFGETSSDTHAFL